MNPQVFVPITDDLIYDHPEAIEGPLVPYSAGLACHNWLSIELNPDEAAACTLIAQNTCAAPARKVETRTPIRLAYSA